MARDEVKNARFWVYHRDSLTGIHCLVKLTLAEGESLRVYEGGPHEEGYSAQTTTWQHEGDAVFRYHESWGSDCDGRYESSSVYRCHINSLQENVAEQDISTPTWKRVRSGQRDHAAEAMGY